MAEKFADKIGLGKQYKGQKGTPTETTGQRLWKFYQRMKAKMAEDNKNG
jgi:hypothetical protein